MLGLRLEGRGDLGVEDMASFKLFSPFFITRKSPFLCVTGSLNLHPDPSLWLIIRALHLLTLTL